MKVTSVRQAKREKKKEKKNQMNQETVMMVLVGDSDGG